MIAVRGRGLRKSFGTTLALDLDELTIAAGEAVAVLGANGAGKTTLLRLLALLIRPDAGEVELFGAAADPGATKVRRRLTFVNQQPYLFRGRVVDEVARGLAYHGVARRARRSRALAALAELGLDDLASRETGALSAGQRVRVALARAFALDVELLLLDEPTAGLDDAAARALALVLARRRGTVVFATHDRRFADAHATTTLELRAGRRDRDMA